MQSPLVRRLCALCAALLASHAAHGAIGRVPGTASVTADGEAAYSIPIQVPTGTNGMTPALSLEYRHRIEGGLLGVGWSISGLSQITRCRRTFAQDGAVDPAMRLVRDRFCLDGQRLVVANGVAYGEPGAEYRTELETFSRIRTVSGISDGPQHFIVEARDGRILEYGATADSRIDWSITTATTRPAVAWALNRIRDRSGNVIDFEYMESTATLAYRIANIRYNSNPAAGVAASHRIAFVYETRPSSEVDITYVAGTPAQLVVRLDRIDVFHGTSLLRRYDLAYEPALSASGRSRLASVQECGRGGTDCLAPTVFRWQNGTPGFGAAWSVGAAIPAGTALWSHQQLNSADINGDGRDDLIYAAGGTMAAATIRYRLAAGGAYGAEVDTGVACPGGIGMPFDYNGDGRSDLLLAAPGAQWRILPGTPSGLGPPFATGVPVPATMIDYRGVDMNADGLGDIAWSDSEPGGEGHLSVRVRLAQSGGFAAQPRTLYSQMPEQGFEYPRGGSFFGRPGARIDLDADGGEDLLLGEYETMTRITVGESWTETIDGTPQVGIPLDMNGDGCTDFAYVHYSGNLRIRVGECGIAWTGVELLGPAWSGPAELRAHDWNSDGRDDILMPGAVNWRIALSLGNSFAEFADTAIPHDGAVIAGAADIDGDGLSDLYGRAGALIRLRVRNGPMPDLLLSATDGLGAAAAYVYRPLTDSAVYARGEDVPYPMRAVQSPAYVVAELVRSDGSGTGAPAATRYSYAGLRHDLLGRGNLGFARRSSVEVAGADTVVTEETFLQEFPYIGLPATITERLGAGRPFSETSYDWSSLTLGTAAAARRFPYPATGTVRRREATGPYAGSEIATLTRSVAAIDAASGIVTDERMTVAESGTGVNAGASATLHSVHGGLLNDTASWCIGRPTSTQLTASHSLAGGDAITRSIGQGWDGPKCRLTEFRREPGNSQSQVTIGLEYDAFGNLAVRSVTGSGMSPRTTTINWGARGQLPATVTNPMQHAYSIAWDHGTGLPASVTDPNALRVAWSYDALGRLIQEVQPQGTSTTWSRAACAGGCDARTRYQLTQRERDSAGITQVTTVVDVDQHDRGFRFARSRPGSGMSVQLFEADSRGREWRRHAPYWAGGSSPGYWQFSYDALDRPTALTLHAPGGAVIRAQALRHDGLAVAHVDALGRTTRSVRTAWGAPAQVVDPAGGVTRYEYDALARLLRVHDALGNAVASASYDPGGLLVTQSEMNSGTWTYARNALGELVALRDARSQSFSFAYDQLGRMTSRTAPDGVSSFSWGGSAAARNIGRLAALAGPGYAEAYAYDAFGRLATRTITSDAGYRYDYAYDAFGLPSSLTYPAAGPAGRFRLAFEHQAGQPVRIRDAGNSATIWQLGAQDAAGNAVDEWLGPSLRVISGFDPVTGLMDYRRTTAGSVAVQDVDYRWDANDNLASRNDLRAGVLEEFRYDSLDRLDDARRNGAISLDLDYDLIGNIRWKSDVCPAASPCYAYDPVRKHAVASVAGQAYAYDASGNMTSSPGGSIAWTSANQPSQIAGSDGNSSRFWYGPAGNLWKQAASHAGVAETTVYAGELMEQVVRGGTTTWRHHVPTPGGGAAVRLLGSDGTTAVTRYLTRDHLGSIDGMLDEGGGRVASPGYAAFGSRRGPGAAGVPGAGELAAIGAVTRDGFTGHEHLDNLGLIHMGGRVYDPRIGRFLSADPHVTAPFNSQSLNRYSYVWNNPLSLADPTGLDPETPCMQAASGACAQITVIGVQWADLMRALFAGGAGAGQVASASERDPCGQDSSAAACALQGRRFESSARLVLSVGTQTDPTLGRTPGLERLQGFAATLGNIAISSSPVAWLFGADPGFEWFDVPDSAAGRAGATLGNVGYFLGGAAGVVRAAGPGIAGSSASRLARSLQGTPKYPGTDRFRDVTLRKGTVIFGGYPGQTAFYTTAGAMRRSGGSAGFLYDGLQLARSGKHPMRSVMAMYEAIDDTPAAFGLAIQNPIHGGGWLPQIVVPSYETSLRFIGSVHLVP